MSHPEYYRSFGGMPVLRTFTLPFEEKLLACDIETKQEVTIHTGEMIHCFEMQGTLYVSFEMYENLFNMAKKDRSQGISTFQESDYFPDLEKKFENNLR